jgi:hypothetical protein
MGINKTNFSVDLIVARCTEDLGWLRNIADGVQAHIYNKGAVGSWDRETALPNVGREAHTYLHHLVTHYEMLADVNVFCQGRPFDHAFDFHRSLLRLTGEGIHDPAGFEWLGHVIDTDDAMGTRLFQTWSKNPEARPLDMHQTWSRLFAAPCPSTFTFACGGQFAITRACIHTRPREFYTQALAVSASHPDAAHAFERIWNHVFGVAGFPEGYLQGRETLYRKPIRRLGDSVQDP